MKIKIRLSRKENAEYYSVELGSVIEIDFEQYIIGVVGSEIGNYVGIEAIKAQAVAARTYAYKSALNGNVITDSSETYQAFKAERVSYENCIKAVNATEGELLYYQGKLITDCVYSSSNQGRIVSAEQRWGNVRPWLISKEDKYDKEYCDMLYATGKKILVGHGVGMSQYGAIRQAGLGFNYKQILSFYYEGTEIVKVNYGSEGSEVNETMLTDAEKDVVEWLESNVGNGYVYGATGWLCTPERRQQQAIQYPDQANNILNISKKWDWKICYDCAQLTKAAMASVGISLPSGATSQWNYNEGWLARGTIEGLKKDNVCLVFRKSSSSSNMQHVGMYCGDGTVIEARGAAEGVIRTNINEYKWTHYVLPNLGAEVKKPEAPYQAIIKTVTGNGINLWKDRSKEVSIIKIPEGSMVTILTNPDGYGFSTIQYMLKAGVIDTKYAIPLPDQENTEIDEGVASRGNEIEQMYKSLGEALRNEGYNV